LVKLASEVITLSAKLGDRLTFGVNRLAVQHLKSDYLLLVGLNDQHQR
jgi:hypothetical protein